MSNTRVVGSALPVKVEERLAEALAQQLSGELVVRFHEGRILSARVTEDVRFRD